MMISFTVSDSGLEYTARFSENTLQHALLPLTEKIRDRFLKTSQRPFCAAVAGPPGSGKSTLAQVLAALLRRRGTRAFVLPLDGFHLSNQELERRTAAVDGRTVRLLDIKGCKESYDTGYLAECLERLSRGERFWWPAYSRKIHQPVREGTFLQEHDAVYLIEGNYLLLRQDPWLGLSRFFHLKLFIRPLPVYLKRRVVSRKVKGGYTPGRAREHFRRSDARNIREVLEKSGGWDMILVQEGMHRYRLGAGDQRSK